MRHLLLTALLASVVAGALTPAAARAEIRLFTAAGAPAGTPVRDDGTRLRAWSATGAHLLVRRDGRTVRVSRTGVTLGRAAALDRAYAIGPQERTVASGSDPARLELRAPDGRVTGTLPRPLAWQEPAVAWSRDGARVAIALGREVVVADTATGAELLRWRGTEPLPPAQAFAPDGAALIVVDDDRVVRLDLATRAATTLHTADRDAWLLEAAWSPNGAIAVAEDETIHVLGFADLVPGGESFSALAWAGTGALAYVVARAADTCSHPQQGVGIALPGGAARDVVAPADREVRALLWSPDGQTLAADLSAVATPEKRGRRRPWPRTIPRSYAMATRAGDAAVRQIVVRAARALKAGARREPVLAQVRLDFAETSERFSELGDTVSRERLGDALDPWLVAAGFTPVTAYDEITC